MEFKLLHFYFIFHENQRYNTKLYTGLIGNRQALTLLPSTSLQHRDGFFLPFLKVPRPYEPFTLSPLFCR